MALVPTQTKDFPSGNCWGITDGHREIEFSMRSIVHAAVTAGHPQGWRKSVLTIAGGKAELITRAASLLSTIYEDQTPRRPLQTQYARLFPTARFSMMDDSEKRGLTYNLGITMSVAWARKELGIPWLMHVNVYEQQENINLRPGRSRPDLVGMHPDGSWVVFESKGRSSSPTAKVEQMAKQQAQRITNIGGNVPRSAFAVFAYFSRDARAIGYKKPKVMHLRINDPTPGDSNDVIELPELTPDKLIEWYYQPWFRLLTAPSIPLAPEIPQIPGEGLNVPPKTKSWESLQKVDVFQWHDIIDLDLRIGVLPELMLALEQRRHREVPQIIQRVTVKHQLFERYPDWAGDGLVIEPGESWKTLWHEK